MAIETKFKIKEIICLRTKDLSTGRARVLRPEDYEEPEFWERIVEEAENNPKNFEIHREETVSEEQQTNELALVTVRDLYFMSREKLSRVAEFYGVPDTGQKRATLADLLVPHVEAAKEAQERVNPKK